MENQLHTAQAAPLEYWSESEKWVWSQVIKGESADFNKRYLTTLDPGHSDGWEASRTVGQRFLLRIT
jgi:hypothetical protein